MTPFMAFYGYHPLSLTSYLRENSKVQAMEDHIKHQQQVLQLLKDNPLWRKIECNNKHINITRKEVLM